MARGSPPPGAPLVIIREAPGNYTTEVGAPSWGPLGTLLLSTAHAPGAERAQGEGPATAALGCSS